MIALLLVLAQAQAPSVGDTVWVSRRVPLPAGADVRPAVWEPAGDVAVLGAPRVDMAAGSVTVRYPLVIWRPGVHRLDVPGPIVILADGRTDSLPSEAVTVTVASVLPDGVGPHEASIQGEAGLVRETVTTAEPLVALLGGAALLFLPVAWWWRRRRNPAAPMPPPDAPPIVPVREWLEDGEGRAVAAAVAAGVREALIGILPGAQPGLVTSRLVAQADVRRPALPVDEVADVLASLEAIAFGVDGSARLEGLAARADRLQARLRGPAT